MNEELCPNCNMRFEDDYWHTAKEQLIIHLNIEIAFGILPIKVNEFNIQKADELWT